MLIPYRPGPALRGLTFADFAVLRPRDVQRENVTGTRRTEWQAVSLCEVPCEAWIGRVLALAVSIA